MPRTYVRKTVDKYSDASLQLAILEVEKGRSIYSCAKEFNIPYETLRKWVTNRPSHKGPGRGTYLSFDEEKCIVEGLKFLAKCGFPFDRNDVLSLIETYFKSSKIKNPFPSGRPGKDFIRKFEKRWANELGKRKPELWTTARAKDLSMSNVQEFFKLYENVLQENSLEHCPERIFNLDEAGLSTDSRAAKVFVSKSQRESYLKSPDAGKSMYTVLFCVSAAGAYLPPFVVYKGLHLYDTWTKGGPPGSLYGCTESGWMIDSVFESWMDFFITFVKDIPKPVLLLFDGHGSHLTFLTVKKAMDNNIIILCLPPNTSHALQPLDVGVFSPLKKCWKNVLKAWYRESRQQKVSKATFPYLLSKLFASVKPDHAVKGFEGSGLFPLNKEKVNHKILATEKCNLDNTTAASDQSIPTPGSSTASDQFIPTPGSSTASDQFIATPGSSTALESTSYSLKKSRKELIPNTILHSPLKDLKSAILMTLSPPQSSETKLAIKNSTRKRKRVQKKSGEILTDDDVVKRLLIEEEERQIKKKKLALPKSSGKQNEKTPTQTPNSVQMQDIKTGSWVRVQYAGKKSVSHFLGQVIKEDDNNTYEVKYLAKSGQKYIFPEKDDLDLVEIDAIIEVLPEPVLNNRGHYSFDL